MVPVGGLWNNTSRVSRPENSTLDGIQLIQKDGYALCSFRKTARSCGGSTMESFNTRSLENPAIFPTFAEELLNILVNLRGIGTSEVLETPVHSILLALLNF